MCVMSWREFNIIARGFLSFFSQEKNFFSRKSPSNNYSLIHSYDSIEQRLVGVRVVEVFSIVMMAIFPRYPGPNMSSSPARVLFSFFFLVDLEYDFFGFL